MSMDDTNRRVDEFHERVLRARATLHREGFSWTDVQDLPSDDLFELAQECEEHVHEAARG